MNRREFGKLSIVGTASLTSIVSAASSADGKKTSLPHRAQSFGRTGVHPNGQYWGQNEEKIDLLSGNLSFSVPLVRIESRGANALLRCSYNSQNDGQSLDTGFGAGWTLRIGSISRTTSGDGEISYVYKDGTGADFLLIPHGGKFISTNGHYFTWDMAKQTLHFAGGEFAVFASISTSKERDPGVMYPTLIQDSNGNQIEVRYAAGNGETATNTSGRPIEIFDARSGDGGPSYNFEYADGEAYITSITSNVGTHESYTFVFDHVAVTSALTGDGFLSRQLSRITLASGQRYAFAYNLHGELVSATLPHGGTISWTYTTFTYSDGRQVREIQSRSSSDPYSPSTASEFNFSRLGDSGAEFVHSTLTLSESRGGLAKRVWTFETDPHSHACGLVNLQQTFEQNGRLVQEISRRWSATPRGTPYISSTVVVRDPESNQSVTSRVDYVRDEFSNITNVTRYGFDSKYKPEKTEVYTYLKASEYLEKHILNRKTSVCLSNGRETVQTTYTYDSTELIDATGASSHNASHSVSNILRGNVTEVNRHGNISTTIFDTTGMARQCKDGRGKSITLVSDGNTNFIHHSSMYNEDSPELATAFTYSGGKMVTRSSPNGRITTWTRDGLGRVVTEESTDCPRTTISYQSYPTSVTRTVNGRWIKKTLDGFGRHISTEKGDATGNSLITRFEFGPSSLAPNGRLKRSSLPCAPGETPIWIDHEYDILGRRILKGSRSGGTHKMTREGRQTTVTDAAGNWKRIEHDSLGRVIKVVLLNPNGGAELETSYTYNLFGKVTSVTMPRLSGTQRREFEYDSKGLLVRRTEPESGTEKHSYNADGTLAEVIDAKGQRKRFVRDSLKRLIQVDRYNAKGKLEHTESVKFFYDKNPIDPQFSQNAIGRLAAVQWGDGSESPGLFTEMYSYSSAGKELSKKLILTRGEFSTSLILSRKYNEKGQMISLGYPLGPTVIHEYDEQGNPCALRIDEQAVVKDAIYTPTGQLSTAKILVSSDTGYMVVTKAYNERSRVQRVTSSAESPGEISAAIPRVDLEYAYFPDTGKLRTERNHLDGSSVTYEYGAYGRLMAAAKQPEDWALRYRYDDFGNRADQIVTAGSGFEQTFRHSPDTNQILNPEIAYDETGNVVRMPFLSLGYDTQGRVSQIASDEGDVTRYGYDHQGLRVWTKSDAHETVSFYSMGKRLATYNLITGKDGTISFGLRDANVFLGRKLVRSGTSALMFDRIGGLRAWANPSPGSSGTAQYFPFGERVGGAPGADRQSFGPYERTNGLDYAEQRYYSAKLGRFISPDPYRGSAHVSDPLSWNRYAYVGNDPVNRTDRHGLDPNNAVSQSTQFSDGSSQQTYVTHDQDDPNHGTMVTVTIISPDQVTNSGDILISGFTPTLLNEAAALASLAASVGKSLDIISSNTVEAEIDYSLSAEIAGGAAVEIATEASMAALATALGIGLGAAVAIFILAAGAYYLYEHSK
ncbi:RHS repeat-associated core domain-containing protein [Terriglobus albidus]|uniref:RHS repeat-associated core domain-containing protein n=1 Tax=Terriglobus albidus TaxID=1592106 RepID=A0A5B9E5M3_9BACT|nr:RHS repeat-associated core domain-containing protein [Terriglobus albidus]QEE27298.1 RHS repeat-associated core domain-containing protein [Terriglobus albidus]